MPTVTFEEVYANAYVRQSIDVIISKTTACYPMTTGYADDFRQQLWIDINRSLNDFDPTKSSIEHYVRMVMDMRIKNILRCFFSKRAVCNRMVVSLEEINTITSQGGVNTIRSIELKMDLDVVIASLPAEQQEVCNAILAGKTWREIAVSRKTPLTTFFQRFILPIREAFQKENLENYLQK